MAAEIFIMHLVDGPFPGDREVRGGTWPLPAAIAMSQERGRYVKVAESRPIPHLNNTRRAQYEWRPDPEKEA